MGRGYNLGMRGLIILILANTVWASAQPASPARFTVSGGQDEIAYILERLVQVESKGNPKAVNPIGGSVGLFQMTQIAVEDVNRLAGTNFTLADMMDGEKCRWAGTFYFTNLLRLCRGDIVQTVACYNVGMGNVSRGIYPVRYCELIIPWQWGEFAQRYPESYRWRHPRTGAWLTVHRTPGREAPQPGE